MFVTRSLSSAVLLSAAWFVPVLGQNPEYRSPAGVTYVSQPDTGGVARAESTLAAAPRDVGLIIKLGLAQSAIRRYREAIATFSRGIAIAPDSGILYRWRGHRYLSVRQLDSARADLEHGLALDSTLYGCWYHLGIVKYVTGDFAGAATAFARALPLAPDSGERAGSIDWSWMSLMRAGRAPEAQAVLDRNSAGPPGGNFYDQRLRLYRGRIGPDQVVTPADTSDIAVATLSYGLGDWYLLRGDTASAKQWFERSVRSGGWPAFGFIAAEAELRRLK
ncbi:MAG TPA: tetratricopeptide repeat protein [Gemmatimonadales bacterium]|nr:tetratricopeptide repeat protein [Gemmatimonadales bacterium]